MAKGRSRKPVVEDSGVTVTSGVRPFDGTNTDGDFHHQSGLPIRRGTKDCGPFEVGDTVDSVTKITFLLAPRNYVLSLAEGDPQIDVNSLELADALSEFPIQLQFQESQGTIEKSQKQSWISHGSRHWKWELVVEEIGETVLATLTAARMSTSAKKDRYLWKASTGWIPFGSNPFEPEDDSAVSLIVKST